MTFVMQPCTVNQESLDPSIISGSVIASVKNIEHKHAAFIDPEALVDSEIRRWPEHHSPISATFALTGSWQPENQIWPHVKVKVK